VIAAIILAAVSAGCTPRGGPMPGAGATTAASRRVLVLSLDSFSESRLMGAMDSAATPALRSLFVEGACANGLRPAFPSMTVAGHASLWTGAYGNLNGVVTTSQPQLPRDLHELTDLGNAFRAEVLRAEPIWVTLGEAGVPVVALHTTHTPRAPGYPEHSTHAPDTALATLRSRGARAVARPGLSLISGYNETLSPSLAISPRSHRVVPATSWHNVERLGAVGTRLLEVSWAVGGAGDSLHALLFGPNSRYGAAVVSPDRDVVNGVVVRGAPTDSSWPTHRTLARHFSPPLRFVVAGSPASARFRLFDLAPDASDFLLLMPELDGLQANHPELLRGYREAIPGWTGRTPQALYDAGVLGRTAPDGGDGRAERRYAEAAELYTATTIAASEWAWRTRHPRLQLEYFLLLDDSDHRMFAHVVPGVPGYDPAAAAVVQEARRRIWSLTDLRVSRLLGMARASGATVVVAGDHGMRAVWRTFRPNVALRDAGLLATDAKGRVDLTRTRAMSPYGGWVAINRRAWKGGIVAPSDEAALLDRVEAALRAVRGPDGEPVVTRTWRPAPDDSLGLGGPVGGDVYYEVAPGYHWNTALTGVAAGPSEPRGEHGFPSVDADMKTVLCAVGPGFPAHRIGEARTIDLAPTLLEYFGVRPAPTVRGQSLLRDLMRP
jgi:predicted AlkP superfamily phosphohydrolase/phosphomutase